jgi:glycosyltransferase involved in cell wall biosynthesis
VSERPRVAVGYVHGDMNESHSFLNSLELLRQFDAQNAQVLRGRYEMRCGSNGLVEARNDMAAAFLAGDDDWLLIIDSDMGFQPDALYKLLQAAHPEERPIVGGLCFVARQVEPDGYSGYRVRPLPTLMDFRPDPRGVNQFMSMPLYPVNQVVSVAATGSAFILIHRSAFEQIAEKHGATWYNRTPGPDGKMLGEDVSFCVRAWDSGVPIVVHTGVRTTHYKSFWLSEFDHWRWFNPPPATNEVAVIVPVLRRPQNAEPFMRSLRASTGLATVYAVADDDDPETAEAWAAAGAEVIIGDARTFARKVNLGYAKTGQPWLFLTGDDVSFKPGWLDHAQHVADTFKADVVGTNDLGNPRVMAGEHSCHLLIRRSYVDGVGASWEGPGVVAAEAYHHWYVDDEIVTAAKQRGVWQMALGSVVEHNHPLWGKAEDDEVYKLGQAHAEDDRATWASRLAVNS